MFERTITIRLSSEDPYSPSVTLDQLKALVAEAEALASVQTIEVHEGEIFVIGEPALVPSVPPVTPAALRPAGALPVPAQRSGA